MDHINIINSIFKWVAEPYVPWIFCGILFSVFFWGLLETYIVSRWAKLFLNKGSKVITDLVPESNPTAFFSQFDAIDRGLGEIKEFKSVWEEFEESTFRDHDAQKICLSRRPTQYFQISLILADKCNVKQIQAWPNYLIGLGLFFTFFGLAAALHVAQDGLQSAAGSQAALQKLLSVASVKFISSLVAVFLSLALSFIQRKEFNSCHRVIHNFCHLIEQRTEFLPAEKILMSALGEQRKQTAFQADMALNIAEKLGGILSKSLPESVAAALEPLAGEIRDLAKKFSGSNENALQQVLQEFLEQLRQSSGQDMDALVNSVQTLKIGLDKLVENLQGLSNNFGQETKDSTTRLAGFLERFTETFAPVQQGLSHFGQTLTALERIAGQIEQAGGNITGAASTNHEAATSLAAVVHGASDQIAPIKDALIDLRASMQSISATADKIQNAGNSMDNAAIELRQSASDISKSQTHMADKMQHFTQAAEHVSTTVATLENASRQMGTAIPSLQQASTGVTQAATAIQQTESRIQEAQQRLTDMMGHMDKTMERIPAVLQSYEQRFGKVDEDLDQAFRKLTDGAGSFQNSVHEFVTQLDGNFTRALNSLSGVVNELVEEREEFFENQRPAA